MALLLCAQTAAARRNGYQGDCQNCHTPGGNVEISLDPEEFEPGDSVRISVTVQSPGAATGGIMLKTNQVGEFQLLGGEGLDLQGPYTATHSSPKPAQDGSIRFEIDWIAPADPAALKLTANVVASNNNNNRSGDAATSLEISKVIGCLGATFYRDFDGDGYGSSDFDTVVDCAPPMGFSIEDGDCNEDVAEINPGMKETCNEIDDNCNGRVDDRATPTCGLGLCRRQAAWCGEDAPCTPGEPLVEVCNGLDDDCDGYIDRGILCEGELVCQAAECKSLEAAMQADPSFVPHEGQVEPGLGEVPPPPPVDGASQSLTDGVATGGSSGEPATQAGAAGAPPPAGSNAGPAAAESSGGCGLAFPVGPRLSAQRAGAPTAGMGLLLALVGWWTRRNSAASAR